MITINLDEQEQVVLYKYEVEELRRQSRELSELRQRLEENRKIREDLLRLGPSAVIFKTADGLRCLEEGRKVPLGIIVRRPISPNPIPAIGDPLGSGSAHRTYKRIDDLETLYGAYPVYEEQTS